MLGNSLVCMLQFSPHFPGQYLSSHKAASIKTQLPSIAPPLYLHLATYLPSPSPLNQAEGGRRQWQGSLHHKTPTGHCLTATAAQHHHDALQKQVDGSCVPQRNRADRERDTEGAETHKKDRKITKKRMRNGIVRESWREWWRRRGVVCPQSPNHNYSHIKNTSHLYFKDQDNTV